MNLSDYPTPVTDEFYARNSGYIEKLEHAKNLERKLAMCLETLANASVILRACRYTATAADCEKILEQTEP